MPPFQRHHRLNGQPQFVGHGNPDPPVTHVKAKKTRMNHCFQANPPHFSD
jgi:hypothetical protein